MLRLFTLTLALAMLTAATLDARTLRWAGRGDLQTTDPHSQNENLTNNINILIYEPLILRNKTLELVPALAFSMRLLAPSPRLASPC